MRAIVAVTERDNPYKLSVAITYVNDNDEAVMGDFFNTDDFYNVTKLIGDRFSKFGYTTSDSLITLTADLYANNSAIRCVELTPICSENSHDSAA